MSLAILKAKRIFFRRRKFDQNFVDLGIDLGPIWDLKRVPQRVPKSIQKHPKIEVENEDEKKSLLGASWIHFGSFRGWSVGEKSSNSIGGASISWKMTFWKTTSVQERFWDDLGSEKLPKGTPRRTQNDTKRQPKTSFKIVELFIHKRFPARRCSGQKRISFKIMDLPCS